MILRFCKQLYPKEALLKAAFQFTDQLYLYLSQDEESFIVDVTPKKIDILPNFEHEFRNEMLAQAVHYIVSRETATLRNIIMGRALSSTMILPEREEMPRDEDNFGLDEILTDWFEQHEHTI
jgi:His-Xaa-Ser system protein HxsD